MQHEEFIEEVRQNILENHAIRLSVAEAVNATEATLETLAEQLSRSDRNLLADRLPPELADFWANAGESQILTLEEFYERIAERESIDVTVASYYVRAVLSTISELLSSDDLAEMQAKLPEPFSRLFERGPGGEVELRF